MQIIPRAKIVDRDEWLVDNVAGKSVLHVGCTDHPMTADRITTGRILHGKLLASAISVVGLDYDEAGVDTLGELFPGQEFICHNAEQLDSCQELQGRQFETVVAADVIEHLSNVGLFLEGVAKHIAPGGTLVVTTPHAFAVKRLLAMALARREFVHDDHTAYFSQQTITRIFQRFSFVPVEWAMFQWRNPTKTNAFANGVVWPILRVSGGRLCDELIVVGQYVSIHGGL